MVRCQGASPKQATSRTNAILHEHQLDHRSQRQAFNAISRKTVCPVCLRHTVSNAYVYSFIKPMLTSVDADLMRSSARRRLRLVLHHFRSLQRQNAEHQLTMAAVAHCKPGKGLVKVNGKPLHLVQPQVLRFKVYEPLLILGLDKFGAWP